MKPPHNVAELERVRSQPKKFCLRYADMETVKLIDSMMLVDEMGDLLCGEMKYYSHGEESGIAANFTIIDKEKNSWVIWRDNIYDELVFDYKDYRDGSGVEIFRGQSGNFKLEGGDELFSRKIKAQIIKFLEFVKD